MNNLDYDYLDKVVLIFWDEPESFRINDTQSKIPQNLFQATHIVNSKAEFDAAVKACTDNNQLILVLVHLDHSKNNRGYFNFIGSGVLKDFQNLRYYLISSFPKSKIHRLGKDEMDVISYDGYLGKIGPSKTLSPQKLSEILSDSDSHLDRVVKQGIFLSHSSKNHKIVNDFREIILEGGLGCKPDDIKFTSMEDHGIPGGIDIPEDLRFFLTNQMGLFIQFVSTDYKKSRVCLNEEGAGWCLLNDKMFVTILIPPANHRSISWVKSLKKAIKPSSKGSLLNLYEDRKEFFKDVNITRLDRKLDEFISKL